MNIPYNKLRIDLLIEEGYLLQDDCFSIKDNQLDYNSYEGLCLRISRYLSKLNFAYEYIKAFADGLMMYEQDEMEMFIEFFRIVENGLSNPTKKQSPSDIINQAFIKTKQVGRPRGKALENSLLTRFESLKLFYFLSDSKAIPNMDKSTLARFFENLTGFGTANSKLDLSENIGLSQEQKNKMIDILEKIIIKIKSF